MAGGKNSKHQGSVIRSSGCELTTDQRLQLVANLIIDRIAFDQQNGQKLLKSIQKELLCRAK